MQEEVVGSSQPPPGCRAGPWWSAVRPSVDHHHRERYVALQIGFDAITSFNELITTVHKFNNDSFTFNDFISRALQPLCLQSLQFPSPATSPWHSSPGTALLSRQKHKNRNIIIVNLKRFAIFHHLVAS